MKKILLLIIGLSVSFFSYSADNKLDTQENVLFPRVQFETNMGNFIVELNRSKAPITVKNFLDYAVAGEYDGTVFHRVVSEFVAQAGGYEADFTPRDSKDPIYNESGNGLKNSRMTIAMARMNKPHSATRQFYFNLSNNKNLDPGRNWGYCVFGYVESGEEVLEKIGEAATAFNPDFGAADVPVETILIKKVTLLPRS